MRWLISMATRPVWDHCWLPPSKLFGRFHLSRQSCRVLMRAFTEAALHAGCQRHTGLAEFVAQTICGGECLLPPLSAFAFEQVALPKLILERGCLHSQQTNVRSFAPVLAK